VRYEKWLRFENVKCEIRWKILPPKMKKRFSANALFGRSKKMKGKIVRGKIVEGMKESRK